MHRHEIFNNLNVLIAYHSESSFFFRVWIVDNRLLNDALGRTQKLLEKGGSRHLIMHWLIQNVLSGWILHNCLVLSGNRNVLLLQLEGDWGKWLDHFRFVLCKSVRVLQVYQSFLNDFVDLILSNQTQILGSWNGQQLPISAGWLLFAQANESSCLCINPLDCFSSLSNN